MLLLYRQMVNLLLQLQMAPQKSKLLQWKLPKRSW